MLIRLHYLDNNEAFLINTDAIEQVTASPIKGARIWFRGSAELSVNVTESLDLLHFLTKPT
jgi:hypothetical protein